ncbi:MAG TPA: TRAM domain-containing protein, partial [Gammaproteobacteria bacterium]|nr:TRAM domain-containing protein [Gammaproteobacteria bacterium]
MALRQTERRVTPIPISRGHVEALSHDGRGITRLNGKTVFIEGALPGEDVDFHVFRRRREYDEARIRDIHKKSIARVPPHCEHFGVCGGCVLQHLAPAVQIVSKQKTLLDNLKRIGGVQPQVILSPLTGPVW